MTTEFKSDTLSDQVTTGSVKLYLYPLTGGMVSNESDPSGSLLVLYHSLPGFRFKAF